MTKTNFFPEYFSELGARLHDVDVEDLEQLCKKFVEARQRKIIVVGNGGSSAIASHVAVDLTKAAGVRALTFNDADLITCFGNDYGYEHWVARAVEFYTDPGDVGVFISSSGRSPNILNGAKRAAELGVTVVTLSGFDSDNPLRSLGALNLWVNSRNYNVVETTHQSWLVSAVDRITFGEAGA